MRDEEVNVNSVHNNNQLYIKIYCGHNKHISTCKSVFKMWNKRGNCISQCYTFSTCYVCEVVRMSCFAFNKKHKVCTCLKNKKCVGFSKCVFYKDCEQAMREAKESKIMHGNGKYWSEIEQVIQMIWDNQDQEG